VFFISDDDSFIEKNFIHWTRNEREQLISLSSNVITFIDLHVTVFSARQWIRQIFSRGDAHTEHGREGRAGK